MSRYELFERPIMYNITAFYRRFNGDMTLTLTRKLCMHCRRRGGGLASNGIMSIAIFIPHFDKSSTVVISVCFSMTTDEQQRFSWYIYGSKYSVFITRRDDSGKHSE